MDGEYTTSHTQTQTHTQSRPCRLRLVHSFSSLSHVTATIDILFQEASKSIIFPQRKHRIEIQWFNYSKIELPAENMENPMNKYKTKQKTFAPSLSRHFLLT